MCTQGVAAKCLCWHAMLHGLGAVLVPCRDSAGTEPRRSGVTGGGYAQAELLPGHHSPHQATPAYWVSTCSPLVGLLCLPQPQSARHGVSPCVPLRPTILRVAAHACPCAAFLSLPAA